MSLTKQIHLYSVATDAFYEPKEQYIHRRLLKLYKLRKADLPKWKKASVNRVIAKEKKKLSALLDERLKDETYHAIAELSSPGLTQIFYQSTIQVIFAGIIIVKNT